MRGSGEAIDAAVLAAPIGVDRPVEGNVGGIVAGDDRPRSVPGEDGLKAARIGVPPPSVIGGNPVFELEPSRGIADGPRPLPQRIRQRVDHRNSLAMAANKSRTIIAAMADSRVL